MTSYYASVRRDTQKGDDYRALLGPFDTHEAALAAVPLARELAERTDPRAVWYAYGTMSTDGEPFRPIFYPCPACGLIAHSSRHDVRMLWRPAMNPGTIYPTLDAALHAAICLAALAPNGATIYGTTYGPDIAPESGEAYQVAVDAVQAGGLRWERPQAPYVPIYTIVRH